LRLQWLSWVSAGRAIAREGLLEMHCYVGRGRAPRRGMLVRSSSTFARHGCRAPPSVECHTSMQGVRGVKAGFVAGRRGGGQREGGGARARGAPPVLMLASLSTRPRPRRASFVLNSLNRKMTSKDTRASPPTLQLYASGAAPPATRLAPAATRWATQRRRRLLAGVRGGGGRPRVAWPTARRRPRRAAGRPNS